MVRIHILLRIQRASVEVLLCVRPWTGLPEYRQRTLDCLFKLEIDNLFFIFKNIFY